jgi:hypothetical protein
MDRLKNWFKNLPDKKKYLELITATLTIPVLLTVVFNNISAIREKKENKETEPKNNFEKTLPTPTTEPLPSQKPEESCIDEIGPVKIKYPLENSTVTQNPLDIDISYEKDKYCTLLWSYRINSGNWSDYTDKSISIYNLNSGNILLEVKVKSIVSNDEIILQRNFVYQNNQNVPTPTAIIPTPTESSNSAVLSQ